MEKPMLRSVLHPAPRQAHDSFEAGAMNLSNQAHLKLSDFVTQLSPIRGVIDHESTINLNQGFI